MGRPRVAVTAPVALARVAAVVAATGPRVAAATAPVALARVAAVVAATAPVAVLACQSKARTPPLLRSHSLRSANFVGSLLLQGAAHIDNKYGWQSLPAGCKQRRRQWRSTIVRPQLSKHRIALGSA